MAQFVRSVVVVALSGSGVHPHNVDVSQRTLLVVAYRLNLCHRPDEARQCVLLGLNNLDKLPRNEVGVGALDGLHRFLLNLRNLLRRSSPLLGGLRSILLLCALPLLLAAPTLVGPACVGADHVTGLCLELLCSALTRWSLRRCKLDGLQVEIQRLRTLERCAGSNRAPLALLVNVNSLEARVCVHGEVLPRLLAHSCACNDSDVPNGRVKLACHKLLTLVVVRLEACALESLTNGHARTPSELRRLAASVWARTRLLYAPIHLPF